MNEKNKYEVKTMTIKSVCSLLDAKNRTSDAE